MNDDETGKAYASPVCYAQELDPLYRGQAETDAATRRDVTRWRRAERERLYTLRRQVPEAERHTTEASIAARLSGLLDAIGCSRIGAYWPIRGEPDLRAWMRQQAERGLVVALPVVIAAGEALRYALWRPGEPMTRGVWGIAEPAKHDWVEPELVIAPLVGVDTDHYRLGNGGGYFDRTLAATEPRPRSVGVGFACARIATIYPQPHDIPMDDLFVGPD